MLPSKANYSDNRDLDWSVRSILHIVGERAVTLTPAIIIKKKTLWVHKAIPVQLNRTMHQKEGKAPNLCGL
jgi:hypothetical protein